MGAILTQITTPTQLQITPRTLPVRSSASLTLSTWNSLLPRTSRGSWLTGQEDSFADSPGFCMETQGHWAQGEHVSSRLLCSSFYLPDSNVRVSAS